MSTPFAEIRARDAEVVVGERTRIGPNVVLGPSCRRVEIGYGCALGRDLYLDVEELTIGDYTTIHHGGVVHGKRCRIGHNTWIGHYTVVDSLGGNTVVGNNVGVGAHSQLWSHMKFGDVLAGCRWDSSGELHLGDDVWLVGHTVVGPITAHPRSMLLTGGVAVKDMEANHVYAGTPAEDVTARLGPQFEPVAPARQRALFEGYLREFEAEGGDPSIVRVVDAFDASLHAEGRTQVQLAERRYWPTWSEAEHRLIRFLLYERAKFLPAAEAAPSPKRAIAG